MFIREKERTKLVTTQFSTFFYRDRIDRWSSKKNLLNSKMPFQSRMMFFRWHQHDAARSNCSISAAARHDDGFSRERGCSKKKKEEEEEDRSEKISREKDKNDGARISILLDVMDKMRLGLWKALVICPTIIVECRNFLYQKLTNIVAINRIVTNIIREKLIF